MAVAFPTAVAGIAATWAIARLAPGWLVSAGAWAGRKSMGVYAGQMITQPFVLVGSGWLGVALSELTTLAASLLLAWALEANALTRAVFLGQWPKAGAGNRLAEAAEGARTSRTAIAAPAAEEGDA